MSAPTNIRSLSETSTLELTWPDGRVDRIPFRVLRESCPCAGCVDEITGKRILNVALIPVDIRPTGIGFSGNYALKIGWSDGHHTGLFTWEYLRRLGESHASS